MAFRTRRFPASRLPLSERAPALRLLVERRLMAGLSQEQLAGHLGVARVFVTAVENGVSPMPARRQAAWLEAIGVDPAELEVLR